MPNTKQKKVKNTDAVDTSKKNCHVLKVQRNVVDKNITPHPARYRTVNPRKATMPSLCSRRTENHPYRSISTAAEI
jgi:hypothetical protein